MAKKFQFGGNSSLITKDANSKQTTLFQTWGYEGNDVSISSQPQCQQNAGHTQRRGAELIEDEDTILARTMQQSLEEFRLKTMVCIFQQSLQYRGEVG